AGVIDRLSFSARSALDNLASRCDSSRIVISTSVNGAGPFMGTLPWETRAVDHVVDGKSWPGPAPPALSCGHLLDAPERLDEGRGDDGHVALIEAGHAQATRVDEVDRMRLPQVRHLCPRQAREAEPP